MTPPSSQAVVVMSSGGVPGPRPPPRCPAPAGGVWAAAAAAHAAITTAIGRSRFNERVQALRIICVPRCNILLDVRYRVSCEQLRSAFLGGVHRGRDEGLDLRLDDELLRRSRGPVRLVGPHRVQPFLDFRIAT